MLSDIARTRPMRSPSQPNTTPPVAAPIRNTAMMTPNHSLTAAGSSVSVGQQVRRVRLVRPAGTCPSRSRRTSNPRARRRAPSICRSTSLRDGRSRHDRCREVRRCRLQRCCCDALLASQQWPCALIADQRTSSICVREKLNDVEKLRPATACWPDSPACCFGSFRPSRRCRRWRLSPACLRPSRA